MKEINLEMPGGRYPYPSTSKDDVYMGHIADMTKQFEAAGEAAQQDQQPVQEAQPSIAETIGVAEEPTPAPVEKPKKTSKKAAPAPTPAQEPAKAQTVEEVQANFETDLSNLKADWEDMIRLMREAAAKAPAADPNEIALLKSEIDAREKLIEEKDAQIAKLKKMVEAAMG